MGSHMLWQASRVRVERVLASGRQREARYCKTVDRLSTGYCTVKNSRSATRRRSVERRRTMLSEMSAVVSGEREATAASDRSP